MAKASKAVTIREPSKPSAEMLEMFKQSPAIAKLMSKAVRRNNPQLIKPGEIPVDAMVHGIIMKVVPPQNKDIKTNSLWLKKPAEDGQPEMEFLLPLTGVIAAAIGENPVEEIGKHLFVIRKPDGVSKKYGKPMFIFDVFTSQV